MKFGKYLAKRHLDLPEYAQYFLNYKALKKLIKRLAALPAADNSELARYARLQQNKSTFFFQLERELEKASTFYTQKEAELEVRLEQLIQRKRAMASGSLGKITRNSVAYISVHEGLQRFRRDLDRLEQFVELNATGFAKVLKKWDKQSRSQTKELYLSRAVEVQPMFDRDILAQLNDRSNTCMLEVEALAQGDSIVFEREATPVMAQAAEATDDLFYEFIRFAQEYDAQSASGRQTMAGWVKELKRIENETTTKRISPPISNDNAIAELSPTIANGITQVFLRSISTLASDDALMALWDSGFVDRLAVDEVAGRSVLHLCANFSELDGEQVAHRIGQLGLAAKPITRVEIFRTALRSTGSRLVNRLDFNGYTPLICAALHNRRELLDDLLRNGADPNICDNDNLTALHYSIFRGYLGCVEDLLDAGTQTAGLDTERQYVPLNFGCQHGSIKSVKLLLQKRPSDPMVADAEGLFPLHIVARAGFTEMVKLLWGAGASVNQLDKLNGWTPLMYGAAEGHHGVVTALLDANADYSILDERGRTAMFYAAWEGHPSSFRVLLAARGAQKQDTSLTGKENVPESKLMQHMNVSESDAGSHVSPSPALSESKMDATLEASYKTTSAEISGMNAPSDDDEVAQSFDDIDEIPDLELPPPIMPLKRYGHNFLDAKKVIVQIRDIQVRFHKDRRGLRASSVTITSSSTQDSIPRNLALPVPVPDHVQTFEVDNLEKLSMVFEVMPTFGTRLLAKAVAGAHIFGGGSEDELGRHNRTIELTMIDLMLRPVGTLEFSFLVVKPFPGRVLDITKYDTYWKSTAHQQQEVSTLSYVTASSLRGTYEREVVTLTRDLVPVLIGMSFELAPGVEVPTPLFTLGELRRLRKVTTLKEWWDQRSESRTAQSFVNIHVPFPTISESRDAPVRWPSMNVYVDCILEVVFEHARQAQSRARGLVFSSTHPDICAMFNWKQPNYPVLFFAEAMRADGLYTTANRLETSNNSLHELPVCKSLREASIFASNNNLMGMACPAEVLSLVPAVVPAIRAMGLVLITSDASPETPVDGVDGFQSGSVVEFSRDIDM